ncbi:hypothetical protein BC629DRAFT_1470304 [Irpex lacteus]|nr:hypothetical protein BC629DRAFT_1470304 [Irpex lacteus]
MGGHRGWETKLSNDLAARHGLTACLYLTRRSSPWLPQRPGQHGYLFCGFEGKDEDNLKFAEPVERAIFIRERVNEWKYFGLYIVQRPVNSDLSRKEWRGLEDSVR